MSLELLAFAMPLAVLAMGGAFVLQHKRELRKGRMARAQAAAALAMTTKAEAAKSDEAAKERAAKGGGTISDVNTLISSAMKRLLPDEALYAAPQSDWVVVSGTSNNSISITNTSVNMRAAIEALEAAQNRILQMSDISAISIGNHSLIRQQPPQIDGSLHRDPSAKRETSGTS